MLDIATQAGYIFEKSSNIDLKRLLLKFVFEKITLTEGVISYKLRFPFKEFVNINSPKGNKTLPYEPRQNQVNQEVYRNDNEKVQFGYMKSCELSESLKNQGLAKNFANPLQFGRGSKIRTHDTRFWRPVLYQLSYTPITRSNYYKKIFYKSSTFLKMPILYYFTD